MTQSLSDLQAAVNICRRCHKPPLLSIQDDALWVRCKACDYAIRAEDRVAITIWNRING